MAPKDNDIIETEAVDSDSLESDHSEESVENEPAEEKATPQKSGRGLGLISLLLALIALIVSGWMFYRSEFQTNVTETETENTLTQADLKAVNKDITALNNELQNLRKQQQKQQQDNQQQHNNLEKQLATAADKKVDLSTINNDISTLRKQLRMLEAERQEAPNEPQVEDYLQALTRAQAVQALKSVQLLLQQNQLNPAITILKKWRNHPQLPLAVQTRLQQIVTTLSNVSIPNTTELRNQLTVLKVQINELSLTGKEVTNNDPAWYEQFITVKKIDADLDSLNSADLQQLKARASAQLNQAELALVLQQSEPWQTTLNQTKKLLSASVLNTKQIEKQLNKLKNQSIIVIVPKNLGIESLIQQIEGITE